MYNNIKKNVENSDRIAFESPNREPLSYSELHKSLDQIKIEFLNLSINP